MEHAYHDALEDAARNEAVRAIVVTGTGRAFCPGLDVQLLAVGIAKGTLDTDRPRRPPGFPLSLPKHLIAAINGAAAGIGLTLALTCDVRFAVQGAKLTTAWARRGLVGEHGMTWLLPRLVGGARGLELMLSGRTFLTDEVHEIGLVHRLTEPGEVVAAPGLRGGPAGVLPPHGRDDPQERTSGWIDLSRGQATRVYSISPRPLKV